MRAFLLTTTIVFGLIVVAHIWRVIAESPRMMSDPWFLLTTVVSAVLCCWAWWLFRRTKAGLKPRTTSGRKAPPAGRP